ncbi:13362_t:CDS:2 [Gigaspora margarita]|uniref:13362_t:CDS:1 n=1 Tax=Gigaspora margarita TaxID=4874 RepID=A0ABN7VUE9_GIGMA|nr:13362_t:CDS:2 [Gigaspora margarita]
MYKKMCDYEVPNEDETDHIMSSKDEIDYVTSSEELFNEDHFVIGLVLFSSSFNDFIMSFVNEIKELEKGIIIDIQENKSLVIASIGNMTANLLQGMT